MIEYNYMMYFSITIARCISIGIRGTPRPYKYFHPDKIPSFRDSSPYNNKKTSGICIQSNA